ncbi:MAG: PhzF family phenazine biosynthesis protein [Trueperaceae bacterium]
MRYEIWDVFAEAPLQGNALAVVHDDVGLPKEARQRWAREFALSETVFVQHGDGDDPRLRIHTPTRELPMAGHPTIGAAFALDAAGRAQGARLQVGLRAGPTQVRLDRDEDGRLVSAWMDQGRPRRTARVAARERVAAALGLHLPDLHASLPIEAWSAGNPFLLVPLRHETVLARAWLRLADLDPSWIDPEHRAVLAFVPPSGGGPVRARMFGEVLGMIEDPGTGSAHGPLGAYLIRHAQRPAPSAGRPTCVTSLQGVEMGRPSRIALRMRRPDASDAQPKDVQARGAANGGHDDDLADVAVEVGGSAVLVAHGTLLHDGRRS